LAAAAAAAATQLLEKRGTIHLHGTSETTHRTVGSGPRDERPTTNSAVRPTTPTGAYCFPRGAPALVSRTPGESASLAETDDSHAARTAASSLLSLSYKLPRQSAAVLCRRKIVYFRQRPALHKVFYIKRLLRSSFSVLWP